MIVKLPIPIKVNNEQYGSVMIRKPSPEVIANTDRAAREKDRYSAIKVFLDGSVEEIHKDDGQIINDKISIKRLLHDLPYRSAELLSIKIMLYLDNNDYIEGVYYCPLCNTKIICTLKEEDGMVIYDTRDRIEDLKITYADSNDNIYFELSEPVEIQLSENETDLVCDMELSHATLSNCISAISNNGGKADGFLQFYIFTESLKRINGIDVDAKWKRRNGVYLFKNLKDIKTDLIGLSNKISEYGIETKVTKQCHNCGKEFRATVNTSNFFDFAALHI